MPKVSVTVNTAAGFDTKYLFPGMLPHQHTEAGWDPTSAYYGLKIIRNGILEPPQKVGNYYRYDISGHDFAWYGPDVAGYISAWGVQDKNDPSNATLATVSFEEEWAMGSFSGLTPDDVAATMLGGIGSPEFVFKGYTGNDTLRGTFWHDELDGRGGADSMIGGDGNDVYTVDNKGDKVVESASNGNDTVRTKISYTLGTNVETVSGTGSSGISLTGNSARNGVSGNNGNNTLKGLGGADTMIGSGGKDVLYGGTGKDFFYFVTAPATSNVDTVKDFSHVDDIIALFQTAHFGLVASPVPAFTPLNKAAFYASTSGLAHDSSDRVLYDTNDGRLYIDADGDGTNFSRKLIAIFTGNPTVAYDDIYIV